MVQEYNFPVISMSIILPAGDARTCASEALDVMLSGDLEKAEEKINEAKKLIKEAHKAQTEVLQSLAAREYNGDAEPVVLPMLFVHAQDTIMTVMSEVDLIEKMLKVYSKLHKEIEECKK